MASFSEANQSPRTVHLVFHKVLNQLTFGSTNYAPKRLFKLLDIIEAEGLFSRVELDIELTFDDGYEHLTEVIPIIMEKYNLTPIVFVPTAWIGKSNSWDYSKSLLSVEHLGRGSIKKLSDSGVTIASHGHTHQSLIELDSDQIRSELTRSKNILEDITGERVSSISYPFGRINRVIMQIAHECGYERGYTMEFPSNNDSKLAIGRIGVWTFDTPFSILGKVNPGPIRIVEQIKAAMTNRLSSGTSLLHRIRGDRVR